MIFFTADTHFDHANIINLCKRPYANVDEMNEALVANWNAVVKPEDVVYHLGDFAFRSTPERALDFACRLNGKVFYMDGNHEEAFTRIPDAWTRVPQCYELFLGKKKPRIVLCHYAMRTWNHEFHGSWHLYGHSHGGLPSYNKSTDVGVDVWNYKPVSLDKIQTFMDLQPKQGE